MLTCYLPRRVRHIFPYNLHNICGKENVVQLVQYVVARKNLHARNQPNQNYLFI